MTDLYFLIGFIAVIVAILLVDMLVIDKEAHEVSVREAGTWTMVWIVLALLFAVFLWFKGDMVHGISTFEDLRVVAGKYAAHLQLDPSNFEASLQQYRHYMTISYLSGYLIEKTLSVDNLFVMMMVFTSFGVSKTDYQRVLNWGIFGAIVMRVVFIFAGVAIIQRFDWVLTVFGVILLYSAYKMFRENAEEENANAKNHPLVRMLSKIFPVYPDFVGHKFFVRAEKVNGSLQLCDNKVKKGVICLTPLFVALIVIEFSDLIFAFDSIPAIFSVSVDPYIVLFSNIFAILGLRAMFFLLSAMADKFKYMKTGVGFLLLFIAIKLLIHDIYVIDSTVSLLIIVFVFVASILSSLFVKPKEKA